MPVRLGHCASALSKSLRPGSLGSPGWVATSGWVEDMDDTILEYSIVKLVLLI